MGVQQQGIFESEKRYETAKRTRKEVKVTSTDSDWPAVS